MKTYDQLLQETILLKKQLKSAFEKLTDLKDKATKLRKINLAWAINEYTKINSTFPIKDIAREWKVSPSTVYRSIRKNKEDEKCL